MELSVVVVADRLLCSVGTGQMGAGFAKPLDLTGVQTTSSSIFTLLEMALARGYLTKEQHRQLQHLGEILAGHLLPPEIRSQLLTTMGEMNLKIDESLLDVPWEIIHDGEQFWGRKFDIGRSVVYRSIAEGRTLSPVLVNPSSMLIVVSDPGGDLSAVHEEGRVLAELLSSKGLSVRLVINPTSSELTGYLGSYPMVHFAGHAVTGEDGPAWSLPDGPFSILKYAQMAPMPFFVFSNTCPGSGGRPSHAALAKAMLDSGVRFYVGTLWDVPDGVGLQFAKSFYSFLLSGGTVGAAIRYARNLVASEHGDSDMSWTHYVLYGDPSFRMFKPMGEGQTMNFAGRATVPSKHSSEEIIRRLQATSSSQDSATPQEKTTASSEPSWWMRMFLLTMVLLGLVGTGALALSVYTWFQEPSVSKSADNSIKSLIFSGILSRNSSQPPLAVLLEQCLMQKLSDLTAGLIDGRKTRHPKYGWNLSGELVSLENGHSIMFVLTTPDGKVAYTKTFHISTAEPEKSRKVCAEVANEVKTILEGGSDRKP